jgi:HD-GYP domain-containing protein (c-di-GMP phosphodiesterase class II)
VIVFYIYSLNVLGEEVGQARIREIEFYKEARKKEASLFEQTTEALANAIDAKDRYTHGHSTRVAMYSRQIAKEAGLSDEECSEVYFAALLHDVGKIGIRDEVINKTGRLTEEEFEHIKTHTVLGNQILSSIRQSPYLSDGAHCHHERYDGKGYPEGLAGEDIPVYARIIAVADAFDAMTSTRSYRDALPMTKVREEIVNGMGKQFDPEFAKIMLHLTGKDY